MNFHETKRWTVNSSLTEKNDYPQINEAALWIKKNELVAFPTETVYGLGANAYSKEAVAKIFQAKGRPSDNPLIIHISTVEQLRTLVNDIPNHAEKLINHFWPGPLTLVLPKGEKIADNVTAGLSTVAVRMPDHPVALAIISAANIPIAAPSANLSGKPSPTLAEHVVTDLNGKIAGIVDGGATGVGLESTVIDCTTTVPMILRPGGITKEQIEAVIGQVKVDPALEDEKQAPKSPGVKYKHYAPKAKLIVVEGSTQFLQQQVTEAKSKGKKVGVLTTVENKEFYKADVIISCGSQKDLTTVARQLYEVLRKFDENELDIIYSESFSELGVGQAIMNRLNKAAGGDILIEI